jgi:hypothetical protein
VLAFAIEEIVVVHIIIVIVFETCFGPWDHGDPSRFITLWQITPRTGTVAMHK